MQNAASTNVILAIIIMSPTWGRVDAH